LLEETILTLTIFFQVKDEDFDRFSVPEKTADGRLQCSCKGLKGANCDAHCTNTDRVRESGITFL
jgi:hypothetical protein